MKSVFVVFMMAMMIVSIHGMVVTNETKEECYKRCMDECGIEGVDCIKICVIKDDCDHKPAAAVAKSQPSSSSAAASELDVAHSLP